MPSSLKDLIEIFSDLPDWEERYAVLIDMGKKLPPYPETLRDESHRVKGCTSQVWLAIDTQASSVTGLHFHGDSDALIVKGLVAVLLLAYNGQTPPAILALDIQDLFRQLGLEGHLSPIRRNGFFSMVQAVQAYAAQLSRPA